MTTPNKIIGIFGGMGPEAGCLMHSYINAEAKKILNTEADPEYPNVIHYALPQYIPDRTEFLLGLEQVNPSEDLIKQAILMNEMAHQLGKDIVACVSCDTFHANPIWQPFMHAVKEFKHLSMLNMADEAVVSMQESVPLDTKIAIFGTHGTMKEKIFESRLLPLGYEVFNLTHNEQNQIHHAIYNPLYGVKANSQATETACNIVVSVVKLLKEQGVQKIILGCTELSIIFPDGKDDFFIDPMLITAKKLVQLSVG